MINFCTNNELRINYTFFDHKEQHKYIFNNTRGQRSMIEYIITNRDIHPSKLIDVRCLNSADVGSDHSQYYVK
ncbi:unnamed protein product [Diabrotica balteata]|uniref:Uncharacterized protein n=1 Tax=Diabrotica balteata TaxID=107213 RepID=A0A9N9SMA8_DIABA|nr:unnamed protein product [Diabrotica balteata]